LAVTVEKKVLFSFGVIPPDAEEIIVGIDESDEEETECTVKNISDKEAGRIEKKWRMS